MDTSSIDWTSIINNTVNQIPTWIAISQGQPVVGTGQQGGVIYATPQGVGGSITPGLLVAGVIALVAVVYLVKR
jgi:hypothetical protein